MDKRLIGACGKDIENAFFNVLKFTALTRIQKSAIPYLLRYNNIDAIIHAPTGQGKTLAYGAPLLALLEQGSPCQLLVVVPTVELASQVTHVLKTLNPKLSVGKASATIKNVKQGALRDTYSGPEIIVDTPGALAAAMPRFEFSHCINNVGVSPWRWLKTVVFDEVDKLLTSSGKEEWFEALKTIASTPPKRPNKILVTATVSGKAQDLEILDLKNPIIIENDGRVPFQQCLDIQLPSGLRQIKVVSNFGDLECGRGKYSSDEVARITCLLYILSCYCLSEDSGQVIVFCNTKDEAAKVGEIIRKHKFSLIPGETNFLKSIINDSPNEIVVEHFSGDLSKQDRHKLLNRFQRGEVTILVATDIAARGIDFKTAGCIINFSPPLSYRDYVHRVGRTARDNYKGIGITIILPQDVASSEILNIEETYQVDEDDIRQWLLVKKRRGERYIDTVFL